MKKNTTTTEANQNWVSTVSVSDEYIYDTGKNLINSPTFIVSTTDNVTPMSFYSKEQMYEMFRLGYLAKWHGPYRLLGKMAIGETTYLPYEAWDSARSAATRLKKDHGKEFQVRKLGKFGEEGKIEVVRKS